MKKALIFLALIALVYLLGPTPDTPGYNSDLPEIPTLASALETYVEARELNDPVKPENDAQIVWANPSTRQKTKVAVVYLHGFTASRMEGNPVHRAFADKYGCNLYLARLDGHGLETDEPLLNFTAEGLWESAKEAYAIGKQLGDEVVVMSTSTGGTLGLMLAANYPEMKGLINFSPNIEINNPAAFLLNNPWGLQISRLTYGGKYRTVESDATYRKYWYHRYRLEAIVELQELLETAATAAHFKKITCPVFNGIYYKDEENQDPVVRVSAVREMHDNLGTPAGEKVLVAFPNANTHVIACDIKSESIPQVLMALDAFAQNQLGMELPVILEDGE
ncbi:MAG: alpha/beta hydrolase [Cryomorphaceae bacterium]